MVSGMPVVVTQAQELANLSLVRQYWDNENAFISIAIGNVKANNSMLNFNQESSSISQNTLSYNAFAQNSVSSKSMLTYSNSLFGLTMGAIATNSDGSTIYTANTNSEWATFDGEIFTDQGVLQNLILSTIKVTTDSADNSYFYRLNAVFGFVLSKYDTNQQLMWDALHTDNGSGNIYLSPDYQRLISWDSDTNSLNFDVTQ